MTAAVAALLAGPRIATTLDAKSDLTAATLVDGSALSSKIFNWIWRPDPTCCLLYSSTAKVMLCRCAMPNAFDEGVSGPTTARLRTCEVSDGVWGVSAKAESPRRPPPKSETTKQNAADPMLNFTKVLWLIAPSCEHA